MSPARTNARNLRDDAAHEPTTAAPAREHDTKERLVDAAEALFAENGIRATSVRDIATAAGANLGAINYHFGSKDRLSEAVLDRRLRPLNAARLRQLDEAEAAAGAAGPALEAVLGALIAPTVRLFRDNPGFMRILGRLESDPDPALRGHLTREVEELVRRFLAAFQRALPHLPTAELFWRAHFIFGAMIHTWTCGRDLELVSGGLCQMADDEALVRKLIHFGCAGFRASLEGANDGTPAGGRS